jgi:glycosyltransferase involved in cell wall biosynthesis
MRVALVSRGAHPLHPPGGMEKAVYHLARHLRRLGVEPLLVTRPAVRAGAFPGEVVEVPYGPEATHGRVLDRSLRYPRFAARAGAVLADRVRSGAVDLVDAQGIAGLGYARRRREDPRLVAPLVMNPQGMEEHKARGWKRLALTRLRALSREAAALADRVVATDEATRSEVPLFLGVPEAKVVVLPNGVDVDEIAEATPPDARAVAEALVPELSGAAPVFLSVGRLEEYKGFGEVLAALARLHSAAALPGPWAWVVVGVGPLRSALRAGLGPELSAHVHLPGAVSEPLLHSLYHRADVFVHAPRFEGSSLVTLEAMAHGLPVVATRAGGIPDKVDAATGWLVEPGDAGALHDALRRAAAAPAERTARGRAGRARVEEKFAWPAIVARTLAVYEELLRASKADP